MARTKKSGGSPEKPETGEVTSKRPRAGAKAATKQSTGTAQAETALNAQNHFAGTATDPAITARAQQAAQPSAQSSSAAAPSDEEIRRKAYEYFEQRGRTTGSDWDDWLRAEQELRSKNQK